MKTRTTEETLKDSAGNEIALKVFDEGAGPFICFIDVRHYIGNWERHDQLFAIASPEEADTLCDTLKRLLRENKEPDNES